MSQSNIHEGDFASQEQISHFFTPACNEAMFLHSSPPTTPRFTSPTGSAKMDSELIYATAIKKKKIKKSLLQNNRLF